MVRTSKNQPSMDAGALDDLDLDDMFADDGDMLFEGLDIQLEGMGDIISNEKSQAVPPPPPVVEPKARTGPRTKRPPPTPPEEEDPSSKRRKTKRKTKTPVVFGDDDEDYLDDVHAHTKKKSRKSAPTPASSKRGKAASASTPASVASASSTMTATKKKKGKKASLGTAAPVGAPPTLLRGSLGVAAAGQFGGRANKRGVASAVAAAPAVMGVSSTPAASHKSNKRSSTSSATSKHKTTDASAASSAGVGSTDAVTFVPKPEETYGGLEPSNVHFYPFMESVPSEPSLKNRKQYAVLDKISSSFNALLTTPPPGPHALPPGFSEDAPIVQLLLESFEAISDKDKHAFTDQKKQAMIASIPDLRRTIQGLEQTRLLGDLYAMCGLLSRQFHFLSTSLQNMESWCKSKFSDADYRSAFSLPEPFLPEKVGTHITSANRKWKKSVITVKLKFDGYKESKGTPTLLAGMPSAVIIPGEKKREKEALSKKKKALKDKTATTASPGTTASVLAASAAAFKVPTAPKSYADCAPQERRKRIMERVTNLALGLESQLLRQSRPPTSKAPWVPPGTESTKGGNKVGTKTTDTSSVTSNTSGVAAEDIMASFLPQDEQLNTVRMWEWMDAAGYYAKQAPKGELQLQAPEINQRGLFLPVPTRIQGRKEKEDSVAAPSASSKSLYDRLQSLLVIEDESDQELNDEDTSGKGFYQDYSDSSDDEDSVSLDFSDDGDDELDMGDGAVRKYSQMSLDERAFVQLRRVGLIRTSIFPNVELVLAEEDDDVSQTTQPEEDEHDDLVDVIGEMSADLSTLTSLNNARIRSLETAINPADLAYRKELEEEQASIIAKCQNLIRRNREKAKKSNRQKNTKKDDLNLPW